MNDNKFEAIAIGGSWGGMEAVNQILSGLPWDYKIPIVVILHRLRNTQSELARLIDKKTLLKVKEIDEKEILKPGTVYLAPANYHVLLESDKTFSLCISAPVHYSRPSIDVFFSSAAAVLKNTLVGIILTGANRDGSEGLKDVYNKGGIAIVQNPEEAEVNTMPLAALKMTKVHHILSLSEIKDFLIKINNHVQS